ncbi:hypothetical protein SAMN05421767_1588 [Granulicatella balaenopterae]|uniref:Uncharacterized protein n=1 Tax=Granulicatella balaenopterae TaxID=137733 RepID=A0A1H9PGS7_9LACT|nr:hypothetical protein [Granulicatella balaenopterae]SER47368.1 hypothetical protein SAMN05421767_1588 [Granulicatella balaenopterae]
MNTKRITVELNEEEVYFLKQYANVYKAERNKDFTTEPIVVVQKEVHLPCPHDMGVEGVEYYEATIGDIHHTKEEVVEWALEEWELNERQLSELQEFLDDEYSDDFDTSRHGDFEGIDFKISKNGYQIVWEPVAYFLTRAEAEKYCKYQAHNLGKCRIYTENAGYANDGDYPKLTKTLLKMGMILND